MSVSSWPELLAALRRSEVQTITLQQPPGSSYTVAAAAQISSKRNLVLIGSGRGGREVVIDCAGAATAFTITK